MPRVLVVDDDFTIRSVVAEALREDGYAVEEAENGSHALEAACRLVPDAILLDLMMPVMDGWEFVRHCHGSPCCTGVPIVLMSAARDLPETAERLAPFGVRGALAKPFDLGVLVWLVERLTTQPDWSAA